MRFRFLEVMDSSQIAWDITAGFRLNHSESIFESQLEHGDPTSPETPEQKPISFNSPCPARFRNYGGHALLLPESISLSSFRSRNGNEIRMTTEEVDSNPVSGRSCWRSTYIVKQLSSDPGVTGTLLCWVSMSHVGFRHPIIRAVRVPGHMTSKQMGLVHRKGERIPRGRVSLNVIDSQTADRYCVMNPNRRPGIYDSR